MNKNESKYFNTAKKMNDALITALETKDFEYITVKEICDLAKVNRSTFYLHYETTRDLLEEVVENMTKSFNEHLGTKENAESIINKKDLNDLYLINDDYLVPYLQFIKDNKKVYKATKNNPEVFNAEATYKAMFNGVFKPIMSRFGLETKYHKYLMDFYMHGISAIIIDWLEDDCSLEIKELSKFIEGLVVKYEESN